MTPASLSDVAALTGPPVVPRSVTVYVNVSVPLKSGFGRYRQMSLGAYGDVAGGRQSATPLAGWVNGNPPKRTQLSRRSTR